MALLNEQRVKRLRAGFEFHLSTAILQCAVTNYLDTVWVQRQVHLKRAGQLSLTWSLMRKTVFVNEGCEVTWLRKVLLVRVQFCIHVLQGSPLVNGGGGQLLFVSGVVVLCMGGGFIRQRWIL